MQSSVIDMKTKGQLLNQAFTNHLSNRPYSTKQIEDLVRESLYKYNGAALYEFISSPEKLEKFMRQFCVDGAYAFCMRMGATIIQSDELEEKFAQYCAGAVLPSRMSNEDFDKLNLLDFLGVFYKDNKEEIEKADKDPTGEKHMIAFVNLTRKTQQQQQSQPVYHPK